MQFAPISPEPFMVTVDATGRFDARGTPTKLEKFSVGALSGIEMALADMKASGWDGYFRSTDYVTFECVDVQKSNKAGQSDMPLFSVSISDVPPKTAEN